MKRIISFFIIGIALAACKSRDSNTTPPAHYQQKPDIVAQVVKIGATGEAQVTFAPKVDIVFIMDDSQSMKQYIDWFQKNVDRLVDSLTSAKSLDIRVGFTRIWDQTRYTTGIVAPVCKGKDGQPDELNYITNGALFDLKLPAGQEDKFQSFKGRKFLSPQEAGGYDVLKASLSVPEQPLIQNQPGQCERGPLVESVLGPIRWSYFGSYNKDFWRPDSLKVFIVLSDAYEGTASTGDQIDSRFRNALRAPAQGYQDKYRVYVAGVVPGPARACPGDYGFGRPSIFPETEIAKLARLSNGKIFSICDKNYGDHLANFGDDIKKTVFKNKVYKIETINKSAPAKKQTKLLLDGHELKEGTLTLDSEGNDVITDGDWILDTQHDAIIVRGDFWNDHPGANITISIPTMPQ
jgi:hypothetical protein